MPCFSQAIFQDTVLPSTLTSLNVQPVCRSLFGMAFSALSACSFVMQWVLVTGGIFIGMPSISISIVVCHLPAFAGPAAYAGRTSAHTNTNSARLRNFILDASSLILEAAV